jgi:cobalamin-dependent methionine synthase I
MYSFLSVAADYPDKHTHKSAMAMAEWAALPVRQEARDRGRLVPGSQEYLDAEAPKLDEEPEEPVNRD